MRNTKTEIRRTLKDYHQVSETVSRLKLQRGSPTVLSGRAWYQKEMERLLREEGIPEEEIPALTAELLSDEKGLEEKLTVYEKRIYPKKGIKKIV